MLLLVLLLGGHSISISSPKSQSSMKSYAIQPNISAAQITLESNVKFAILSLPLLIMDCWLDFRTTKYLPQDLVLDKDLYNRRDQSNAIDVNSVLRGYHRL